MGVDSNAVAVFKEQLPPVHYVNSELKIPYHTPRRHFCVLFSIFGGLYAGMMNQESMSAGISATESKERHDNKVKQYKRP